MYIGQTYLLLDIWMCRVSAEEMIINLHRKASDSYKLSVYIWLLGADPRRGSGLASRVPTLTSEPGYATAGHFSLQLSDAFLCRFVAESVLHLPPTPPLQNKKAQLSLTNPRDACKKFARFT